ncbi:MAG: leucine-rich repeat domain-containing protein [Mycoplasma sp.]
MKKDNEDIKSEENSEEIESTEEKVEVSEESTTDTESETKTEESTTDTESNEESSEEVTTDTEIREDASEESTADVESENNEEKPTEELSPLKQKWEEHKQKLWIGALALLLLIGGGVGLGVGLGTMNNSGTEDVKPVPPTKATTITAKDYDGTLAQFKIAIGYQNASTPITEEVMAEFFEIKNPAEEAVYKIKNFGGVARTGTKDIEITFDVSKSLNEDGELVETSTEIKAKLNYLNGKTTIKNLTYDGSMRAFKKAVGYDETSNVASKFTEVFEVENGVIDASYKITKWSETRDETQSTTITVEATAVLNEEGEEVIEATEFKVGLSTILVTGETTIDSLAFDGTISELASAIGCQITGGSASKFETVFNVNNGAENARYNVKTDLKELVKNEDGAERQTHTIQVEADKTMEGDDVILGAKTFDVEITVDKTQPAAMFTITKDGVLRVDPRIKESADYQTFVDGDYKLTIPAMYRGVEVKSTAGHQNSRDAFLGPIQQEVKSIEFEEGCKLEVIGEKSFTQANKLTGSVIFPKTLKVVEENGFSYTTIEEIILPESLEVIGDYGFCGNRKVTGHLILPSVNVQIGKGAFDSMAHSMDEDYGSLTRLYVHTEQFNSRATWGGSYWNKKQGYYSNVWNIDTPEQHLEMINVSEDGVASINPNWINDSAFNSWDGELLIPREAKTLFADETNGEYFSDSIKGKLVRLSFEKGSTLETIPTKAFYDCTKLINPNAQNTGENLRLPNTIKSIGDDAFGKAAITQNSKGLTGIDFGKNPQLKTIGARAFKNQAYFHLTLTIPSSVEVIEESAFESVFYHYDWEVGNHYFGKIRFENGSNLKTIGNRAFAENERIIDNDFKLPNKIETIGDEAFYRDTYTYKMGGDLVFPSTLTSIGAKAFQNTGETNAWTIDFAPNSNLKTIGESAFEKGKINTNLIEIPTSVQTIGANAFKEAINNASARIIVSAELFNDHANVWSQGYIGKVEQYSLKNLNLTTEDFELFLKSKNFYKI